MKRNQIVLGKIMGIPIGLDHSWFLIFALLTWMLADGYFPKEFAGFPVWQYWFISAITSLIFFMSVLIHELGHSAIAMHYKLKVRRITLFIFGGIAEITEEPKKAIEEFWIAIAGPITSFILALLFYYIAQALINFRPAYALFHYLALINFILAVFNLIPGFPLDGGRVFRAIVWGITKNFQQSTKVAAIVGRFFGFFFILIGAFQVMGGNLIDGLWIAFIGWFLESAASSQLQMQELHKLLAGHTVQEAMSTSYGIVPWDLTIRELMDNEILSHGRRFFIVRKEDNTLGGMLTLHSLKDVPRQDWETTKVSKIMIPFDRIKKVNSDYPLLKALTEMDTNGVNQLPVFENDELIGILSRESIINYFGILHETGLAS
ncbi:putative zinc metalloprotease Rip3 [bacterium BMS3Abin03]|nr:putative zinc metalloprotease Rip3 [bacterium BMS3Abin03]